MAAVERSIESGWWLNGSEMRSFNEGFAAFVGVDHCISVANGTDALEIAMRALQKIRPAGGREVITVANAGGYSTIACRLNGLTPVYVDIEVETQLACIDSIISALSGETAFVIVTHLYGGVVDVRQLRQRMDQAGYREVPILEDCAQAHGAKLNGEMVGSLSDLATFSFYPTKNLGAFGDAGAITTSNSELSATVDTLRQYGWSEKYTISTANGRNSRIDEVQAAILNSLLPGLEAANMRRTEILNRYVEAAPDTIQIVRSGDGTVAHLAIGLSEKRDELRAHMAAHAISTDIHYPVLDCDQPGWKDLPHRIAPGGLKRARYSVSRLITFPCFPTMFDEEVHRVCKALTQWKS